MCSGSCFSTASFIHIFRWTQPAGPQLRLYRLPAVRLAPWGFHAWRCFQGREMFVLSRREKMMGFIHLYIYISIYIYTYMYIPVYIYIYTHMHMYVYMFIYSIEHVLTHLCKKCRSPLSCWKARHRCMFERPQLLLWSSQQNFASIICWQFDGEWCYLNAGQGLIF